MSQTLQYNYIQYNTSTGEVISCFTCSYEIPLDNYVEIPYTTDEYVHKYYNFNGDQMFYHDPEFTRLWEECPSHNV